MSMCRHYRHHRRLRCWLAAFAGSLACWAVSAADPLPQQVEHPFRNLAAWLREVSPDLRSAETKAISRGITVLSNSQSYVKSFDGMAYELKGKIKEGSSTDDITKLREEAELYESATSAKKAAKLTKLLIEVEKALNSAEAAEIASQFDPRTVAQYMKEAGLRPLPIPPPPPAAAETASSGTANVTAENNSTVGATEESRGLRLKDLRVGDQMGAAALDMNVKNKNVDGSSVVGKTSGGRRNSKQRSRSKTMTEKAELLVEQDNINTKKSTKEKTKSRRSGEKQGESKKEAKIAERSSLLSSKEGKEPSVGDPLEAIVVRVPGHGEVQCLVMVDDRDERLVIAVGDALSGEALLRCLFEEPAVVRLASHGLMQETAFVNPPAFQAACDILESAGPHIKASLAKGSPFEGYTVHCTGHSFGGAVAACLAGMLDGAIEVEPEQQQKIHKQDTNGVRPQNGRTRPKRSQDRNTSRQSRDRASGEVGRNARTEGNASDDGEEEEEGRLRLEGAVPWMGMCADVVTCVTLGCPPCLSQNLRIPFVTSFVLGDDMVPRTSHESLRRLKIRLLQVMPKGKGLLSQGMAFGTSLFTDVAGVAMQGVRQATTSGEDDARLKVPGRVWFAKPRRLKNGATLARVMQGNIKEDMLWQLHDIMLTKSMLSHHRLDKYIKILDRV